MSAEVENFAIGFERELENQIKQTNEDIKANEGKTLVVNNYLVIRVTLENVVDAIRRTRGLSPKYA